MGSGKGTMVIMEAMGVAEVAMGVVEVFGLQMFNAPGANVRGMGGNRYNPISRGGGGGNFNNVVGGPINKHNQGFNNGGFSRGAFSGTRGMPARGGFARGGSRGGGPSWN